MSILAILLATAAPAVAPECLPTPDADKILKVVRESPTPRGMIIGLGSDWGSRLLVVKTTHRLPSYIGVSAKEGTEEVTYIASSQQNTCWKKIEASNCPSLKSEIETLSVRSYSVMYKREGLRQNGFDHPPYALLHSVDGDGNATKIISTHSVHPLMGDIAELFEGIKSCTKEVNEQSGL